MLKPTATRKATPASRTDLMPESAARNPKGHATARLLARVASPNWIVPSIGTMKLPPKRPDVSLIPASPKTDPRTNRTHSAVVDQRKTQTTLHAVSEPTTRRLQQKSATAGTRTAMKNRVEENDDTPCMTSSAKPDSTKSPSAMSRAGELIGLYLVRVSNHQASVRGTIGLAMRRTLTTSPCQSPGTGIQ